MSAIDTTTNVHLCTFAGIAVYWCPLGGRLDYIIETAEEKSVIKKRHIFIGGGSGEHPALLLDINKCVRDAIWYLAQYNEFDNAEDKKYLQYWDEKINDLIMKDDTMDEVLDQAYGFDIDNRNWDYESFKSTDEFIRSKVTDQQFLSERLQTRIEIAIGLFALLEFPDCHMFCENRTLADFFNTAKDFINGKASREVSTLTEGLKRIDTYGSYQPRGGFSLTDYIYQVWNKQKDTDAVDPQ